MDTNLVFFLVLMGSIYMVGRKLEQIHSDLIDLKVKIEPDHPPSDY